MGHRIGIAGYQNSGKSFGRRWIPDGENVMILAPSVKVSHLYTGPANAKELDASQLDAAILAKARKPVGAFDLVSPEGKYKSLKQLIAITKQNAVNPQVVNEVTVMQLLIDVKPEGYFKPEHFKGNKVLIKDIERLQVYLNFINKFMPWVHTVILPDFTHFITEKLTSLEFRNKVSGNEQYKKYLDLAADGLRNFITSIDDMREDLIVVTEFHAEFKDVEQFYELFVPGGKMIKEKFLPSSYYDVFLFTDVQYADDENTAPVYSFVTSKTKKYPEARSMGIFPTLRIPNNLQDVLTAFRESQAIELLEY